ncbi:MAG: hypothetical protein WC712_11710 [Candidatus Brocadiia bacterium]
MNEREKDLIHTSGASGVCPVCGETGCTSPECEKARGNIAALSGHFSRLSECRYPEDPVAFEKRLARTLRGAAPFARSRWESERRFYGALRAVGLVAALAIIVMAATFYLPGDNSVKSPVGWKHLTLAEMSAAFSAQFGRDLMISADAGNAAWLKRATVSLSSADPEHAASAVARAFDLAVVSWNGKLVLRDRTVALAETGKASALSMDIAFSVDPSEIAELDSMGNSLVAVDTPHISAKVTEVQIPLRNYDSKVISRPGESFEVRRSLPWFAATPEGKLEFMAMEEEDFVRFEPIRRILRGEVPEDFGIPARLIGPFDKPVVIPTAATVREALDKLAREYGFDYIVGSGAEVDLPVPASFSGAKTLGDALDSLCDSRYFYFTYLPDVNAVLIDSRPNLQRFLCVGVAKMAGKSPILTALSLRSSFQNYFAAPQDRTGEMVSYFRDFVIVRHHVWPLLRMMRCESVQSNVVRPKN